MSAEDHNAFEEPYCERLRRACHGVWLGLKQHPFINEMAAGTLPEEKFRFYIEQNLLYLPEYAAAIAIGAAKARGVVELARFAAALTNIVEVELPENRTLLQRLLERGAADRGGGWCMAPATLAYTSFLLATAFRGGPLEIMTAIMPCAWSYFDIASAIVESRAQVGHPIYSHWIAFFADRAYAGVVARMRREMEDLAHGAPAGSFETLTKIFTMGARLEHAFWDMAYALLQWPDLAPQHN
jgi:thiaminase/transcriptional activator TenA